MAQYLIYYLLIKLNERFVLDDPFAKESIENMCKVLITDEQLSRHTIEDILTLTREQIERSCNMLDKVPKDVKVYYVTYDPVNKRYSEIMGTKNSISI